jgi:membrane associated rhomboid family serine protease
VARLAIERLTMFIVGGMGLAYVLCTLRPEFTTHLLFVPALVRSQPWRVVTFLFLPPPQSMFFVLMALYFTWLIGTNLEQTWGALKFNAYYFLGALGTIAAGFATGTAQTNVFLNMSLFFAFATLFPDYEVRVFFVLPVKMKWLGLLSAAFTAYQFIQGGLSARVAIGVIVVNYLLFFGTHLLSLARQQQTLTRQAGRRAEQRGQSAARTESTRACAICGARQEDGADIRVCSCAACGGAARELCLEHARNH